MNSDMWSIASIVLLFGVSLSYALLQMVQGYTDDTAERRDGQRHDRWPMM